MKNDHGEVIKFKRGAKDILLLKDFFEILTRRYFPVLSLTYISSVVAIAAQRPDFLNYLAHNKTPYVMALFVALWVSIPAILWILMKGIHLCAPHADTWYKICSILMMMTLCISFILFPEADAYGLRLCLAATIPMLFIMYFFFVRGGLPGAAAHPLSALGLTFLIYGSLIGWVY